MIAIPGDTSPTHIRIIADEMAIGMINNKTTAVRLIPVYGKSVGETVTFGGLLVCPDHARQPVQLFGFHQARWPYTGSGAQL